MYPWIYQQVLFPFYESFLRRRNTLKYLKTLEKNQWLSENEIKEIQWNELKKLLQHAYENVPFYTEIFNNSGLTPKSIKDPDDFRKLPIIDKSIIRANYDRMIAKNIPNLLTKSTGGSTGEPLHFVYTRDSYEWRRAITMRGYSWAGFREGDRVALLWGVQVGKTSRLSTLKSEIHNSIQNKKYFNIFDLSPNTMLAYFQAMKEYKPKHIISYALGMYYFAKYINEMRWSTFPIKSIILGAEKASEDQIKLIESTFNCPVFNTYGCREFMLIASQCEERDGMHISADNLFVEILKNGKPVDNGEIGEVIVTDLHNYGMPFIRYKNGDLAIASEKPCSCGRGLPLIADVEGRIADAIITTEGKIVTGLFFPHLMKEFKEVEHFQVIQESKNLLTIKLIPRNYINQNTLNYMKDEIQKVCGKDMKINFELVNEIPLTASGKRRVTVSKVELINIT